jgi:hypothetical protein
MLVASNQTDPHGRIHPMYAHLTLLVLMTLQPWSSRRLVSGDAPSDLAVDPSEMITEKAISEWKRWQTVIQTEQKPSEIGSDSIVQDTVGAVSCTIDGEVSAGVSSGGILLKPTGRIGEVRECTELLISILFYLQAACFGAGCWASGACGPLNAVACSISGTFCATGFETTFPTTII